jgi:FMN-dependent NADH-azoreductase
MKILRIDSSADTESGQSRRLADHIIDRLRKSSVEMQVTVRDLSGGLPTVTAACIKANKTPSTDRSPEQARLLDLSETLIGEIEAADTLIIGLPVYNFSVPASLKLWIDLVCRARRTFNSSEAGPKGLMVGKRAIVCYTSGGTGFGSSIDFASGYVRHILGFIGIVNVSFVAASQHFSDPSAIERATNEADQLVDRLLSELVEA